MKKWNGYEDTQAYSDNEKLPTGGWMPAQERRAMIGTEKRARAGMHDKDMPGMLLTVAGYAKHARAAS